MNANKTVLQSTKAQLEAQKQKTYDMAYATKYAELKEEIDLFASQQLTQLNKDLSELKNAYEAAVAEKKAAYDVSVAGRKASVEEAASVYANKQASVTDELINQIDVLLARLED